MENSNLKLKIKLPPKKDGVFVEKHQQRDDLSVDHRSLQVSSVSSVETNMETRKPRNVQAPLRFRNQEIVCTGKPVSLSEDRIGVERNSDQSTKTTAKMVKTTNRPGKRQRLPEALYGSSVSSSRNKPHGASSSSQENRFVSTFLFFFSHFVLLTSICKKALVRLILHHPRSI